MPFKQTDGFLQKKLEKNELVARPAFCAKNNRLRQQSSRGYHITKSLTAYVSMYFHIANCSFFPWISLMLSYDILTVQSQPSKIRTGSFLKCLIDKKTRFPSHNSIEKLFLLFETLTVYQLSSTIIVGKLNIFAMPRIEPQKCYQIKHQFITGGIDFSTT